MLRLKEYFYNFMDSQDKEQAIEKLKWFRLQSTYIDIAEYKPVMTMLRNWEDYIVRGYS